MTTETAQKIVTPGFIYMGFDVPGLEISTDLIDNLGTSKPAYELAPKSIPLAWWDCLYLVGRDLTLGFNGAESLPEPVREAGKIVYSDAQERKERGGWHKDAILFEGLGAKIPGSIRPGRDYIVARYFKGIKGFKKEGKDIDPLPDTREEKIWLPPGDGRFIVPTKYGELCHLITGTPKETIKDRKEAIKRWVEAGFTEEQAEKELSMFYRGNLGTYAVYSWSSDSSGPLCIRLYNGPGGGGANIGSFAVSRSAERSEAPKNKGFRMLTKAEYESFVTDRNTLGELRETLQELAKK